MAGETLQRYLIRTKTHKELLVVRYCGNWYYGNLIHKDTWDKMLKLRLKAAPQAYHGRTLIYL